MGSMKFTKNDPKFCECVCLGAQGVRAGTNALYYKENRDHTA